MAYVRRSEPSLIHFATSSFVALIGVVLFILQPTKQDYVLLWILCATVCSRIVIPYSLVIANIHLQKINTTNFNEYYDNIFSCVTPLLLSLILLGSPATAIHEALIDRPVETPDEWPRVSASRVHFGMDFFLVTECEFYMTYWMARMQGCSLSWKTIKDLIVDANTDSGFEESRDCHSYHYDVAQPIQSTSGHWTVQRPRRGMLLYLLDKTCFQVVVWVFYFIVPIVPWPRNEFEDPAHSLLWQVLQTIRTPKVHVWFWLSLLLQRPYRLLNRMIYRYIVATFKQKWDLSRVFRFRQGGQTEILDSSETTPQTLQLPSYTEEIDYNPWA